MPARPANPLLNLLSRVSDPVLLHIIEVQQAQLKMYKARQPKFRATKAEKDTLVKLAKPLGTKVRDVLFVCVYASLLRWARDAAGINPGKKDSPGRPPLPDDIRQLVIRLAEENPTWGYSRILGELAKRGKADKISRSTIKNILDEHGIEPSPKRKGGDWASFLKRHAKTIWACDFVSRKVLTRFGVADCFVLFFIHLESRRVHLGGVTTCPNRDWLTQQARNVCIFFNEQETKPEYLLHDRDGKFNEHFCEILRSEGIEPKKLPAHSPNCNAFAERWVQSFSNECLNHFVIFGEGHMRHLAQSYVDYYNSLRPHQSKGNHPLGTPADFKPSVTGAIKCQEFLGGLLKHYYREAA